MRSPLNSKMTTTTHIQTKNIDQKISDGFHHNNDIHEADTSVTGDYATGLWVVLVLELTSTRKSHPVRAMTSVHGPF